MKQRVHEKWTIPRRAKRGEKGAVKLHIFIDRRGRVSEIEVVASIGPDCLVDAARNAIEKAHPFPRFPLEAAGEDRVGVSWFFSYGMSGGEVKRWRASLQPATDCHQEH